MNDYVSHELLERCARICGWPAVNVGSLLLSDRGAWQYAIDRSQDPDRQRLIVALGPQLLTATEGGRARLAAQHQRSIEADDEPYVVGDSAALPIVRAALALVPPAVRIAIQREVVFLAVGTNSVAWTISASLVDCANVRKTTLINLGPAMSIAVALHEIGHAWTRPIPDEYSQAVSVQGEAGFRAYMAEDPGTAYQRLKKWDRDAEAIADGLALSWLYAAPESKALPA